MKILLVETWHSDIYAEPFYRRFRELGVACEAFRMGEYFQTPAVGALEGARALLAKAEDKYRVGLSVERLNRDLARRAREADVVFVIRGEHVFPETLEAARRRGALTLAWHNDNPLSAKYPPYVWRHAVRALPLVDQVFAYRTSNVTAFRALGCRNVELLRSFYIHEMHHPVPDGDPRFSADVSFVGHYENDGRDKTIDALLSLRDVRFRLWGPLWERAPNFPALRARFGSVEAVRKTDYNLALCSTKIALVLLSKLNEDTYTRRCFEIPATGTFMLSEYTDDLASMFEPDREAVYFSSAEELTDKVRYYVAHDTARKKIADAGRARLLRDGHEARDRAIQVLASILRQRGAWRNA